MGHRTYWQNLWFTSSPPYICYFMTSPLVYPVIIWLVSGYHFPLTGIQTPVDYIRYLVDYIRYPDAAGWFMFLLDSLNHWCKQPKSAENCAFMTPKFKNIYWYRTEVYA